MCVGIFIRRRMTYQINQFEKKKSHTWKLFIGLRGKGIFPRGWVGDGGYGKGNRGSDSGFLGGAMMIFVNTLDSS